MDKKLLFVLFDEEELTKTLIENYLKELPFSSEILRFNKFDETLIPNDKSKKIIIVNVSKTNAMVLRSISKLSIKPNNLFLLISYDKSADLQVNALRTGAKDFLFKPLIQSDFVNSIMKIYKENIVPKPVDMSPKVISVISREKAIGKTFFAFNFAKEIADISGEKVLLIDFNNNLNDLSYILNLNIKYNTPYILNKINNDNAQELLSSLSRYKKSSLFVMANGTFRNEDSVVDVNKIADSLNILKKYFKYIVVDTDISSEMQNEELYKNSNAFYFIIGSSLASVELTKQYLDRKLQGKSVKIILNRYNARREENIANQIEQKLGKQIYAKISKNVIATSSALSQCATIKEISPQIDIVKVFDELAREITNKGKKLTNSHVISPRHPYIHALAMKNPSRIPTLPNLIQIYTPNSCLAESTKPTNKSTTNRLCHARPVRLTFFIVKSATSGKYLSNIPLPTPTAIAGIKPKKARSTKL